MDGRRLTQPSCWLKGVGLGLLLLGAPGCDGLDPSVVFSASADSGETLNPATAVGERRSADMQSIGPEDTQRVYYQFIDDRGRVQFVERLSDVPAAWREQVGYVEMSQPPPLTPLEARKTWRVSTNRAAEIMLANANTGSNTRNVGHQREEDVILYSATWCGYCTKARAHLDGEGIQYELRDVDNDAVARELREKTGRGGVPVLDFSGEILRGYSSPAYDKAIQTIRG